LDLYLVRHAVAFSRDPERWPDDSKRPLSPAGEKRFRDVALGLGKKVPPVELVLSSPYARAWRTAEILAEDASWPEPEPFDPLVPGSSPKETASALADYADLEKVALVGHRPCLHELAAYLLTDQENGADIRIKKGGVICLRFGERLRPGAGSLRWLATPKMLKT
jgi:phosphohistidine phosphatase